MRKYLEYKNEITGYEDVLLTVKTTEKIAASYIHFLKDEVRNLKAYTRSIERVMDRLLCYYGKKDHPLLSARSAGERAAVIITGNKGLVGDLYHKTVNFLLERNEKYGAYIAVGGKGCNYLNEEGIAVEKLFSEISDIPLPQEVAAITGYIFAEYGKGRLNRVDIFYPRFVTLSQYQPVLSRFLPFDFNLDASIPEGEAEAGTDPGWPIFEPGKTAVFDRLLRKYIAGSFMKIIMEAKLSEYAARTITTEHAAVRTEESMRKLMLKYLNERRKITTQKQIESFIVHQIK